MSDEASLWPFSGCPIPIRHYDRIVLGHGGGGLLTADLVHRLFVPAFHNDVLARLDDAAECEIDASCGVHVAFTTDAFVVRPPFFPGGDVGRLSICGTVNDLAVSGATPLFVSAAFVLEEGLAIRDLERIVLSMRHACEEASVSLVAGDTKVVERGKGDHVFITTSGIGVRPKGRTLSLAAARPGDVIVVSGTLGDHGIAILSVREGIAFETVLESDCAPLGGLARAMLEACPSLRCMRDPTRGGLASTLNELATAARVGVVVDEPAIPTKPAVRAACEILGFDVLTIASEGRLWAVVPREDAPRLLEAMRAHPLGAGAERIGEIVSDHPGIVVLRSGVGSQRVLNVPSGEQLPRIC